MISIFYMVIGLTDLSGARSTLRIGEVSLVEKSRMNNHFRFNEVILGVDLYLDIHIGIFIIGKIRYAGVEGAGWEHTLLNLWPESILAKK